MTCYACPNPWPCSIITLFVTAKLSPVVVLPSFHVFRISHWGTQGSTAIDLLTVRKGPQISKCCKRCSQQPKLKQGILNNIVQKWYVVTGGVPRGSTHTCRIYRIFVFVLVTGCFLDVSSCGTTSSVTRGCSYSFTKQHVLL